MLAVITDPSKVLFPVTVYDDPKSTVRYQVPVGDTMEERLTTYAEWVEMEAKRMTAKSGMSFGIEKNELQQISLVAVRRTR